MANFSQLNRPISINTPLGFDALLLEKVRGVEAVSELFEYQLDMLAEVPIDFDQLLGTKATVSISLENSTGRRIEGILIEIVKGPMVAAGKGAGVLYSYRAILAPPAWLLTQRIQSRIFQAQAVPHILKTVLQTEWQLSVEFRLTATYPDRQYCVQYAESDWAFVNRLMEHEGITYFFRHDDKGTHLVLADYQGAFGDVPQPVLVEYDERAGIVRNLPVVRNWERKQRLGSYRQTVRDYHFEKPTDNLTLERNMSGSVAAGALSHPLSAQRNIESTNMLERYEYPGRFAHHHDGVARDGRLQPRELENLRDDLERILKVRHEEESTRQLRIQGSSDCGHFVPGHLFSLIRHFDSALPPGESDKYFLTRVELEAGIEGTYTKNQEAKLVYSNRFECLPAKWPCRPARVTPCPRVFGPQTATVVGPPGQDVHVDPYGRVKVRFHWDRESATGGDSSCWVRVAQFWAGKGWGAFFWPRVGNEVVVAFEDGDPDRPLIVGSVYNSVNMPPFTLPKDVSASGVKSCSLGGEPDRDFNWLVFHDAPDNEHVHIHSENHQLMTSEASRHRLTPGPSIEVAGVSPFATLGSGSGGGSFTLGSGSGGGILDALDLAEVAQGHDSPSWLKKFGHAFPGSANFVWGSVISSCFLGDQVKHALLGANVTLTVDPEGILWDNIDSVAGKALHGMALAGAATATALLAGVGGNFGMTLGPNTSLTYFASNLSVTRGESYQFKAPTLMSDWTPVGIGVKVLSFLIAGGALASDICAKVYGGSSTEGGKWAIVSSRVFVQRLMGLLRALEVENAILHDAEAKAKEAEAVADQSAKLLATIQTESVKMAKPLVDAAAKEAKTALALTQRGVSILTKRADTLSVAVTKLEQDMARTDKVFTGDYSLTAKDISLISTSAVQTPPDDLEASTLTISARGGGNNGAVIISGTKQVTITAVAALGVGGPLVGVSTSTDHSTIALTNAGPGYIMLTQGIGPDSAKIDMQAGLLPPEITMSAGAPNLGAAFTMAPTGVTLSVGAPGAGASLELKPTGVTLKFAAWSLTMNAAGISLEVGPNNLKVSPGSIELNGMLIKLIAQLESEQQAVSMKITASALQQMQAAIQKL